MQGEHMTSLRIVGISGNVKAPSRTSALVASILRKVDSRLGTHTRHIDLVDAAPALFRALRSDQLDAEGLDIVRAVETADALVVASPVYRASYSGALKHLFDLVHFESLIGKPVIIGATGGTPLHGLMTDHQLRPLFGFFKTLTLPTSVYALEGDFAAYSITNPDITRRIDAAVQELEAVLLPSQKLAQSRADEWRRLSA
jgi:FMN reductase